MHGAHTTPDAPGSNGRPPVVQQLPPAAWLPALELLLCRALSVPCCGSASPTTRAAFAHAGAVGVGVVPPRPAAAVRNPFTPYVNKWAEYELLARHGTLHFRTITEWVPWGRPASCGWLMWMEVEGSSLARSEGKGLACRSFLAQACAPTLRRCNHDATPQAGPGVRAPLDQGPWGPDAMRVYEFSPEPGREAQRIPLQEVGGCMGGEHLAEGGSMNCWGPSTMWSGALSLHGAACSPWRVRSPHPAPTTSH